MIKLTKSINFSSFLFCVEFYINVYLNNNIKYLIFKRLCIRLSNIIDDFDKIL